MPTQRTSRRKPGGSQAQLKAEAPLMLSVSGARGIVGQSMTPLTAAQFAACYGATLVERARTTAPVVCVGRDSRPSGQALAAAAMSALASVGCRVVNLGVVMTPSVAVMIREHKAAGGMVLTASHNPVPWNGLKCLTSHGVAPPPAEATAIVDRFRRVQKGEGLPWIAADAFEPMIADDTTHARHVALVLDQVNVKAIRRAAPKVVLDSVNGAGCVPARMLLDALGCKVLHLNGEPTGRFAHPPEPVKENLTSLCAAVRKAKGAVAGFAQDPDADRLAVVDERGTYIGEEYTLVLAARCVLARRGQGRVTLAANLSTSRMIDDVAAALGGKSARVLRTPVGEAHVAAAMMQSRAVLGGEGNGGVILPEVCLVRDSLSAMALVLELLATDVGRRPLSALINDFPRYVMVKHKFDATSLAGHGGLDAAFQSVAAALPSARANTADGLRLDLPDSWVHLRASNTEPIIRLIAEAPGPREARALVTAVADAAGLRIA